MLPRLLSLLAWLGLISIIQVVGKANWSEGIFLDRVANEAAHNSPAIALLDERKDMGDTPYAQTDMFVISGTISTITSVTSTTTIIGSSLQQGPLEVVFHWAKICSDFIRDKILAILLPTVPKEERLGFIWVFRLMWTAFDFFLLLRLPRKLRKMQDSVVKTILSYTLGVIRFVVLHCIPMTVALLAAEKAGDGGVFDISCRLLLVVDFFFYFIVLLTALCHPRSRKFITSTKDMTCVRLTKLLVSPLETLFVFTGLLGNGHEYNTEQVPEAADNSSNVNDERQKLKDQLRNEVKEELKAVLLAELKIDDPAKFKPDDPANDIADTPADVCKMKAIWILFTMIGAVLIVRCILLKPPLTECYYFINHPCVAQYWATLIYGIYGVGSFGSLLMFSTTCGKDTLARGYGFGTLPSPEAHRSTRPKVRPDVRRAWNPLQRSPVQEAMDKSRSDRMVARGTALAVRERST